MLPPGVGLVQCAAQTGRRDAEAFSGGRGGERLVEDQPGCLAGEGRAPRSYARLASGSACSSRSRRRAAPRLEALVGITRPDRSGWLGWHVYAAAGSPAGERRPVLHWHASMRLVRTSRHTKKVWTACSSGFRRLCSLTATPSLPPLKAGSGTPRRGVPGPRLPLPHVRRAGGVQGSSRPGGGGAGR